MINRLTDFTNPDVRAALSQYFSGVDRELAQLPQEIATLHRDELEAHIFDALDQNIEASLPDAQAALERLGEPTDFLPALVADILSQRAGRTFHPVHVAIALTRSATISVGRMIATMLFGVGYMISTAALILGVLSLFFPDTVGAFRLNDGSLFIGADEPVSGVRALNGTFGPIAIISGIATYIALTWAYGRLIYLRPNKNKKNNPETVD